MHGVLMEEQSQKSCWGVTAKAMIGFGIAIMIAYVVGIA